MRRLLAAAIGVATFVVSVPAFAAPGPHDAPQYWFDQWKVPALWDAGARGQGVTIAVLDTGVNGYLPELRDRVLPGRDFGGGGGDGRNDRAVDSFGHGTAMASIMVARPGLLDITGTAPDARVLPVALPIKGTSDAIDGDQLPAAIRYAADAGAQIINLSLGGERTPGGDQVPCPTAEQAAITYAVGKGSIVVAASGNDGRTGSPVEDPGVCLGVVAVGAVDRTGTVADFSSRHAYLTVTAPGVAVASLGRTPGTAYSGDGTSQATALTSSVLALIWSKYPRLTGRQVVSRLIATARLPGGKVGDAGKHDDAYGYGTVDAHDAVMADVPADTANPVYDAIGPFLARAAAPVLKTPAAVRPARALTGSAVVGVRGRAWTTQALIGVVAVVVGLLMLVGAAVTAAVRAVRAARARRPDHNLWYPPPVRPV